MELPYVFAKSEFSWNNMMHSQNKDTFPPRYNLAQERLSFIWTFLRFQENIEDNWIKQKKEEIRGEDFS